MHRPLLLGAIADDYTGAADLASMLREQGLRTGLLFGVQADPVIATATGRYDAVVIALKSRSVPAARAREDSLRALEQLRRLGARQLYFKYCSTFDSTVAGNIGPVIDALMEAMETDFTIAVPALPVNGRTQYRGHLFVGDALLSESPMRHHPVTPMTEPNLVRHLQGQTSRKVGLIGHPEVRAGASGIRSGIARCRDQQVQIALVDAICDDDLHCIAEAVVDLPMITGGSGLGMSLPAVWTRSGLLDGPELASPEPWPDAEGVLILSGSCSAATLGQLSVLQDVGGAGLRLDTGELLSGDTTELIDRLVAALRRRVESSGWALVYSSATPEERIETLSAAGTRGIGSAELSRRIERVTGELARRAVEAGIVDSVVVAGGETTGAVTQALGVTGVEIGPALDPGVPVARSMGSNPVNLVFKSGNFGAPDFFVRALRHLGLSAQGRASAPAHDASPGAS